MSSAPALFAMRISGSTRASAALARSSDGKTLSVTAITGRIIFTQHFRIHAVRRTTTLQEGTNIVHHDVRHLLSYFGDATAEMRREHDVGHFPQRARDLGLVLEHIEARAGDLFTRERADQRRFVDDGAASGINQERRLLHEAQFARADLVAG